MKIIKEYDDFVELDLSTSTLLIDKKDLYLVKDNVFRYDKSIGYYHTTNKHGKKIYLHRLIMGDPYGLQVDHINQNKTDNRRENLRSIPEKVNKRNISGRSGSSIYRGVYWHKTNQNWATNFVYRGKKYVCGSYQNEVDAAIAIDHKIDEISSDVTMKNFPLPKSETTAYLGGTFDGMHPGHTELFINTKKVADRVVVSVNTDEFNIRYKGKKTIFTLDERVKMLRANKYVDEVVVNIGGEDSSLSILTVKPDYIVHGDDWTGDSLLTQLGINKNFLSIHNIYLVYMPYTPNISTTELKRRIHDN